MIEMTKTVRCEKDEHVQRLRLSKVMLAVALGIALAMLGWAGTVSAEEEYVAIIEEKEAKEESEMLFDITDMTDEHIDLLIRSVIDEDEEIRLAKMVYGEDRQNSLMERSATVWCAFNRSDEWDMPISSVVVNNQFHGYFPSQECPDWAVELVRDVALRYALEGLGYENVGRTLPSDYLYFSGSGGSNRFRTTYSSRSYWDWDAQDPYDGEYDMMELVG